MHTCEWKQNTYTHSIIIGLYAGMGVHLMKVVPNSAIMFLTYEVVKSYLSQYTIITAAKDDTK